MTPAVVGLLDGWARSGREPGAAVCAWRGDDVLADHAVGTRDGSTPWTPDTLVMSYSVAKPLAALTVLDVVAAGGLDLDQRVADLWPEYAAHGKEATTVRHVLNHAAGVPVFPPEAADVAFDDLAALTESLAGATPDHEPGSAVAEHALTYGHLCDALVRRATGDDLADRFARIAAEHGWDLHLRVTGSDLDRVADVVGLEGWPALYTEDPRWGPAMARPAGMLEPAVLNSERFRRCSFPAIALHASARGLAGFYRDLLGGPVRDRLGADLHAAYVGAAARGHDRLLDREVTWTLGFQLDDDDLGMGGAGGCAAWFSLTHGYAAAYVTRGLGDHDRGDAVWQALSDGAAG